MKFEILESSSKANGYLINDDLLIDVGFVYSKYKDKLKNVKYVCLTHRHTDHFKTATIRKLIKENKEIIFICPLYLFDRLCEIVDNKKIVCISPASDLDIGNYSISAIFTEHNVENVAYIIRDDDFNTHLHSTDLANTDVLQSIKCDTISLEANHHTATANEIIEEANKNGEFSHLVKALDNHLSVSKAIDFVKKCGAKIWYVCHTGDSTRDEVLKDIEKAKLEVKTVFNHKKKETKR